MAALKLAHPLDAIDAVKLGLEDRDYEVGEPVDLERNAAQTLIARGFAIGVDPEDNEAVASALDESPAPASTDAPDAGSMQNPTAAPGAEGTAVNAPATEQVAEPAPAPAAAKTARKAPAGS